MQSTATASEYKLVHGLSGKCIDIDHSLLTNGADALIFTCKTTNDLNQTFKTGVAPPPPPPTLEQPLISGEYWGLPTRYPAKSPHGGLNQIWGRSDRWSPVTDMVWIGAFWRDLNPQDGVYDRARLEESRDLTGIYGLDEAVENGKTVLIWTSIQGFQGGNRNVFHAPDNWLKTKCGTQVQDVLEDSDGNPNTPPVKWGLSLWNPCPLAELVKYIKTMFGPYKTNDDVKYAYVTTLNAGEWFMPTNVYNYAANLPNGANLTPQKLEAYGKAIIDAWIEAVGANKVVWTRANDNWVLPISDPILKAAPQRVTEYALLEKGLQLREGNGENFMANLIQPRIDQNVDPVPSLDNQNGQSHWYLKAKTIQDMLPEPLTFYGDEFEIADKAGAPWRNGAGVLQPGNYPYYRLAVLNMLRKGMNWAIFPQDLRGMLDQDPLIRDYVPLRNYFRQTAGYPVEQAPDAWVTLHETNDNCAQGVRHYHNYEKFLHQRERTGGMTKPAQPLQWGANTYAFSACQPAIATTHFAKRTDWFSDNDYIYFDLDSDFAAPSERRFRIAVTYQDTGTASWRLEYNSIARADEPTPSVTNGDTDAVRTAIFSISDASFNNALGGEMDFRIWNGGEQKDVVIRSVRVLRGGQ